MTDHDDAPDWTRLPADPQAFFGLPAGYGQRDLKLAYAALIKIYKPEQRPEEFRLIRAAYDALDAKLRGASVPAIGGGLLRDDARRTPSWPAPDADPHAREPRDRRVAPKPAREQSRQQLLAALRESGPEALYERLRDDPHRTPLAFVWLAFLSDLVPGDSATGELDPFLRWLGLGLAEYPGHRGLLELVARRCAEPHPGSRIPTMLAALAAALTTHDFARASEPLWRQLLEQARFDVFAALHLRLLRGVTHVGSDALPRLRITLLHAALWRAPPEWIADEWTWLMEHQQVAGDLELDALEAMRDYRAARASGTCAQGELHEAIEQVARAACDRDEARVEILFLELQARMVDDADLLLATFPRGDATAGTVLALLQTVALQRGIAPRSTAPLDQEALRMRAVELLNRLHARSWRSPRSLVWQAMSTFLGVSGLICFIVLTCLLALPVVVRLPEGTRRFVVAVVVAIAVALVHPVKRLFERVCARLRQSLAERRYHHLARSQVLRLLRAQNTSSAVLDQVLRSLPHDAPDSRPWLLAGLATDPLPPLYAFALRFA